jgi:hypothetical protein
VLECGFSIPGGRSLWACGEAEITRVIEDLAELKRLVQQCQHVTEITSMVTVPEDMIHELKKNWELNKEKLITMIDDLSAWLTNHINKTGVISILGM